MTSWDRLHNEALDTALSLAETGGEMLVFAGGWHVWFDISVWTVDEDGMVRIECLATSVPPEPPSERQHQQMTAAGWTPDRTGWTKTPTDGFWCEHRLPVDQFAPWVADRAVETLRSELDVSPEDVRAGPIEIWPELPGVPPGAGRTVEEQSEVEGFFAQVIKARTRRAAENEKQRPHREASEALGERAIQQRDRHRELHEAASRAGDLDLLLLHQALAALAKEALGAANLREYDPGVQRSAEALLDLVDEEQLGGAWGILAELFDASEQARDRKYDYIKAQRKAREEEIELIEWPTLGEPPRAGQAVDREWHHIAVTALVIAGPREQLIEALKVGAVTSKDVEYALAGVPRTRGSEIGARRRELIKLARQHAMVETRDGGSYLPLSG